MKNLVEIQSPLFCQRFDSDTNSCPNKDDNDLQILSVYMEVLMSNKSSKTYGYFPPNIFKRAYKVCGSCSRFKPVT